jgi:hypothetical protein
MRYRAVVALLFASYTCSGLPAQTFSLIAGREPVVSLRGLWRFHTGDDPEWAAPTFNDSQWPLLRSNQSWTEQGYPPFNGYAWYRFRIEVPGDNRPVALLLGEIVNGYQVFVNGRMLGSVGAANRTWNPVFSADPTLFPIPITQPGPHTFVIAIRVWTYRPIASWYGSGSVDGYAELGDASILSARARLLRASRANYFGNEYAFALFSALVGFAVLALFVFRTSDKEYLWFSVMMIGESADVVLHLFFGLGTLPFLAWRFLTTVVDAVAIIASLQFFAVVLGKRRTATWWITCGVAAASTLTIVLIFFQWTGMGIAFAITGICLLPAYFWIIAELLAGSLRRDMSARILLLPVLLLYGLRSLQLAARIAWQLTGTEILPALDPTVFRFPFVTRLVDFAGFVFILALLTFLVRRFSLARQEEERLASEISAARVIQSLLIPTTPPSTPGFKVENIYLPANEVGGDFFQVMPGKDGSLLLVVGDVSGKGLKAAMTVSATVGALRGCATRDPGKVLSYLNPVLCGQVGGFVTCCVVLLFLDGRLIVANAGHLFPYLNGKELAVNCGLPLGIVDGGNYEEANYRLSAGDRLTFISDGIVEARDTSGTLFGFERTRAICQEPAQTIAQTAKAFGQEDDIMVLTVTLEPMGAAKTVCERASPLQP